MHNRHLVYAGRADFQVKTMGKRVQLESVEAVLSELRVCIVRDTGEEETLSPALCRVVLAPDGLLVAFVSLSVSRKLSASETKRVENHLQRASRSVLEPHAVPRFRVLADMPLNGNGKVDRAILMDRLKRASERADKCKDARADDVYNSLMRAVQEAFPVCVSPEPADFFLSHGGTSADALRVVNVVKETMEIPETVVRLLLQSLLNKCYADILLALRQHGDTQESANTMFTKRKRAPSVETRKRPRLAVDAAYEVRRGNRVRSLADAPASAYICPRSCVLLPERIPVLWSVELGKCIDASPLILQGASSTRIIIGSHACNVVCLLSSGDVLWEEALPDRVESSACAVGDGSLVAVGCNDGHLYCLDADSGRVAWKVHLGREVKSSPVYHKDTDSLWVGSHDGYLYVISCSNRAVSCRYCMGGKPVFSSPEIFDAENEFASVCAAGLSGKVLMIVAQSGEMLWEAYLPAPVFSSPAAAPASSLVLCGCVDGNMYALQSKTGAVVWKADTGGPVFCSPVSRGSRVFVGSHGKCLLCVDAATGDIVWRFQSTSEAFSSPSIVESCSKQDAVMACSTDGTVVLLSALSGKLHRSVPLPGPVFSSPVCVGGLCIVGCRDDNVYCLQLGCAHPDP